LRHWNSFANKITVGVISGIGAVNNAVLKFFDPQTKKYFSKEFSGSYEIAPLNGNISAMNGRAYLHLHINLTDSGFNSFGGHLESAIVSATFEAIIEKISGRIGRSFDEQAGLNIFKM